MTNHPNRNRSKQQQPTQLQEDKARGLCWETMAQEALESGREWKRRFQLSQALNAELLAALKLALPYIERVADTTPTEMNRQQRQRQACTDAGIVRAAIARADGK